MITIASDNVTVDLNGQTLRVFNTNCAGIANIGDTHSITVKNGKIIGGNYAIDFMYSGNAAGDYTITDLEATSIGSNGGGIYINGDGASVYPRIFLERLKITKPGSSGIIAWGIDGGRIRQNVISDAGGSGIDCFCFNLEIAGNTITKSSNHGLYLRGGSLALAVRSNVISNNLGVGIYLDSVQNAFIQGNNIANNGSDGIATIGAVGNGVTIDNNTISGNGGAGINMTATSSFTVRRNTVTRNGTGGILSTSGSHNVFDDNIVAEHTGTGAIGLKIYGSYNIYSRNRLLGNTTNLDVEQGTGNVDGGGNIETQ